MKNAGKPILKYICRQKKGMKGKIINDPVYGFIKFPERELMQLISHRYFQRLRNIKQMGMAHFVYPGAVHTRFHHSLGAAHLMHTALNELRSKNIDITDEETLAARQAILLHDIGHGPFSHALEYILAPGIAHEAVSRLIMQRLNDELGGLDNAIAIFNNHYPKKFLHHLVSSQLDMDRMDYLNRDSFYTGVSEGVIGYDRILQMLTVVNDNLAIEEKGIYSVEKFIIARRLMYWQVYLHKTVLGVEMLIINILKRAKHLAQSGAQLFATPALRFFLYEQISHHDFSSDNKVLELFCLLDDSDMTAAIKVWATHEDKVLSDLCSMMVNRKLYKVKLSNTPLEAELEIATGLLLQKGRTSNEYLPYYAFTGSASNSTYDIDDDRINILMKTGELRNISEVENALINSGLTIPVKKYFLCVAKD